MTVATRHRGAPLLFDAAVLGGITAQQLGTGTEIRAEATSGDVYAKFLALVKQDATGSFTTMNIAAALALAGLEGVSIDGMTAGFSMFEQKDAQGGTRTAGANHRKLNMTAGIITPNTLSADQDGDATIDYDITLTDDGAADIVTVAETTALPTHVDAERFAIGPITIGGVSTPGVKNVSIAFGVNVVTESADGDISPTFVAIQDTNPVITIRGVNAAWFSAAIVPLLGKAGLVANTSIYFRKRALSGTFVTDVTAEHIKITSNSLTHVETIFDASNAAGEVTLTLTPYQIVAVLPLVIVTASAIT